MMAHHFLWTYPKNSHMLACRFKICEVYSRGEPLWKWIKKIQAMKAKKIIWDHSLDSPETEIFVISVDGVDCRIWEKKHPTKPRDTALCSKKFNHGAVKYELALSVFRPKLVWMNGPFVASKHDPKIFREDGLKDKLQPGKIVIADKGYKADDLAHMVYIPNAIDDKDLKNFKSRVRCRHETFNGRIKHFSCLSETFRHGMDKHKIVFEAVCVIVQYLSLIHI